MSGWEQVPLDKVDLSLVSVLYIEGNMAAVTPKFNYDFTVRDSDLTSLSSRPSRTLLILCQAKYCLYVACGRGSRPSLASGCACRIMVLPLRRSGQSGAAFCPPGEGVGERRAEF